MAGSGAGHGEFLVFRYGAAKWLDGGAITSQYPVNISPWAGLTRPSIAQRAPMPAGFVYILASKPNGTLYIGITSNLHARMEQHHRGEGSAFVKKYSVHRLVHFEEYPLYTDAIRRETNLKRWKRQWKIDLIEKHNPRWFDLIENWHR